jgi:hypothetical protein
MPRMRSRTALLFAGLVTAAIAAAACSRSSDTSSSSTTSAPPSTGTSKAELKTLTVDEVAARVAAKDGRTFVYDNNPKERYQQGHVPGARWVASGDVTASVLPADKTATLVFYCANEA